MPTETVAGTFNAIGQSAIFDPATQRDFNISIWGTFVGTVALKRSFDGGTTWLTKWPVEIYQATTPRTFSDDEPEAGVIYRLECTAFTSGTINYRMSQ